MSHARRDRVEALFQRAADLPASRRASFLESETGDDVGLRHAVEELLEHMEAAGTDFLRTLVARHADALGRDRVDDEPPPARLGVYEVRGEIGRGGMGVVYRAHDPRLARDVAIKVVPSALARDPEWQARIRREARLLASVNHPNIATIHSLEESGGASFITMELLEGDLLATAIASGTLTLDRTLAIADQLAAALEAAHRRDVAHRDLKPGNVILTREGLVKVLDFGLATLVRAPSAGADEPISGTPGYVSPEQLEGARGDHRADIWAFGCVLYECLSGRQAFAADSLPDQLARTLRSEPDWTALPSGLSERFLNVLRRCLVKSPDERVDSIAIVRREVEEEIARRSRPAGVDAHELRDSDVPNNIPLSLTSFVGRTRELDALGALLGDHPLVTLVGPGGAGKSRLAIEVARRRLADFPDGVWLVELAAVSGGTPSAGAAAVERAVAATLDVRDDAGEDSMRAISRFLSSKRALLILDNCEHVVDAAAAFVSALGRTAEPLTILATSREALGVTGEIPHVVSPMREGAIELFIERAAALSPGFTLDEGNREAIASICDRLDGIPLAIELAAARTRVLPPSAIAARLDDRFRLLTAGSRTALPRHRTLRALIDWSYDQLDENERLFLTRLSVFAGGWTLDAAEAVCAGGGIEPWEALDLLSRLLDKSLAEMVPSDEPNARVRYRMLETVRAYAREKLEIVAPVVEAHATYFASVAAQADAALSGPDQADWLERLDHDYENFRLAIEMGTPTRPEGGAPVAPETLRMAATLVQFSLMRGRWIEGRRLGEEVLARPGVGDVRDEPYGMLVHRLGALAQNQGDRPAAHAWFDEALEIWDTLGIEKAKAGILNNKGLLALGAGEYDEAGRLFEAALAVNRRIGNRDWEATNLNNLSLVCSESDRHDTAVAYLEEALAIGRELGNTYYVATFIDNLANARGTLGELAEAQALHEEGLELNRRIGNLQGVATSLLNLGTIVMDRGHVERAHPLVRESLEIKHRMGDVRGVFHALESMGALALRLGRPERGVTIIAAATALREKLGMPVNSSQAEARERELTNAGSQLEPDAFDRAWRRGQEMTADEAVRFTLEDDAPPASA